MHRTTLLLIALLAIPASGSHAQAPDGPTARNPLDRRDWGADVRRMRATEREELDALARRAREAGPGAAHAQAQRDLEDAKRQWRRRLLEAQLARVRAAGLADQAQRIEERLTQFDAVARRRVPVAPAGGAK